MINTRTLLGLGLLCSALLTPHTLLAKALSPASSFGQTDYADTMNEGGFELLLTGSNKIFPDNRMMYTVFFENTGYKSSDYIDITSPLPPDTVYLPNTANGENCDILFSVDGGESWGSPEQLQVQDSKGQWHTATAADYTHIKWLYMPELRPAEVQQVSFQVRLQ